MFNGVNGEMMLYRVTLDWNVRASTASVEQSVSIPVPSGGHSTSRHSFSLPVSNSSSEATRRMSGIRPAIADPQEDGHLVGKETILATWNLKRGRDWAEVKGISSFETLVTTPPSKKKDFPE